MDLALGVMLTKFYRNDEQGKGLNAEVKRFSNQKPKSKKLPRLVGLGSF